MKKIWIMGLGDLPTTRYVSLHGILHGMVHVFSFVYKLADDVLVWMVTVYVVLIQALQKKKNGCCPSRILEEHWILEVMGWWWLLLAYDGIEVSEWLM